MALSQALLDSIDEQTTPVDAVTSVATRINDKAMGAIDEAVPVYGGGAPNPPARASMSTALATNADQYAEAAALAKHYNMPGDFVERNLDWARQKAKLDGFDTATGGVQAAFEDPHIAKLGHDDVERLSELERQLGQNWSVGFAEGSDVPQPQRSFSAAETIRGPKPGVGSILTGLNTSLADALPQAFQSMRMQMGDLFGFNSVTEDAARKASAIRTRQAITTPEFESDVGSGLYSGTSSLLQQIPAMAVGVATGSVALPLASAVASTEAEAYTRYRERGATPGEAIRGAAAEGVIEGITEKIPMGFFVEKFGKEGLKSFLVNFVAIDALGEQAATFLQDAVDTAVANPDATWKEFWAARPSAAVQTLAASAAMGGATAPLHFAVHRANVKAKAANTAIAHAKAIDQVNAIAANSLLRERSPEDFGKVLDQMVGSQRDFYIDGDVFLQAVESGGEAAQLALAKAPTVLEQLDEALPTNGLIRIPAKEFLQSFSKTGLDTALIPHLRVEPDAPSGMEAEQFLQQQAEETQAAVEVAMDKIATNQAFADSAHAVEAEILAHLTAATEHVQYPAGVDKNEVNRVHAQFARDIFVTQAARHGVTPEEMYKRFQLQVVAAQSAEAGALNQGGLAAFMDGNVLATPEGRPVQLYHGTRSDITEFDPARGVDEQAVFLTPDPALADFFSRSGAGKHVSGSNIVPVFARLTNPKVIDFTGQEFPYDTGIQHLIDAAKRDGHDGMILRNVVEGEAVDMANGGVDLKRGSGIDQFVVFDAGNIKSSTGNNGNFSTADPNILKQNDNTQDVVLGAFAPKTLTISMLERANLSTFLHELGHFQLTMLADMASQPGAPPDVAADFDKILNWFGVKDGSTWNAMSIKEQKPHHEQLARGFEAYLFEGKAPTADLEGPFARIKQWLMRVYKSLKELNVTLSDEVRGVFDRLVAADADIKATEEARSMLPLFETRETFPGTDEEWAAYRDTSVGAHEAGAAQLAARSLRDMQFAARLRLREINKLQRDAAEKYKAITVEAEKIADLQPVYAVQDFLRGKPIDDAALSGQRELLAENLGVDVKLNLDMLKGMYGDADDAPWRRLQTGKNGIASTDGVDPEIIANIFLWGSADEMVQDIVNATPRAQYVEALADKMMFERYGDLADQRAIEQAVDEAIHNKVRTRMVATELAALETGAGGPKGGNRRPQMLKAMRNLVKAAMGGRRVGDIKVGQYVASETRAAKTATAALKAGDQKAAINAKRQQLWHNLSATEARKVESEIDRALKYLKKFDKRPDSVAPDYLDRIEDLLDRFDLRRRSEADVRRTESLTAWLDLVEEEKGVRPVIDPALEDEGRRTPYRRMTLDEFRGLVDTVRSIEHIGRTKQKLVSARRERELTTTAAGLGASAEQHAPKTRDDGRGKYVALDAIVEGGDKFLASHRKLSSLMSEMDGFKPGLWSEVFLDPINQAGANGAERMGASAGKLLKIFEHVVAQGWVKRNVRHVVPGAVDRHGRPLNLSYEERLVVLLNSGNKSNHQRMRDGDRWSDQTMKAIVDSLDKKDWDFAQAVWDHLRSYRDEIGALEKDLKGVAPEWIDPDPIESPHGVYPGGYYHVAYDTERSLTAVQFDTIADMRLMMRGVFGRMTTRNGFTQRRAKEVTDRPVSLRFSELFKHISDVNHRLAWERTLADTRALMNQPQVKDAIQRHLGPKAGRAINELLTETAIGDLKVRDWFDETADRLSANASLAIMGMNMMTAATQPLGLTQTIAEIGYKATWDGVMTFYKDPRAQIARVKAKSAVMRTRSQTWNQNISYLQNQLKAGKSTIRDSAFIPMTFMQGAVDFPTWIGAYQKALGEGLDDGDAVARADQVVLDTQGGGQTKDLSAAQRGKGAKALFTRFYNYSNTTFNLLHDRVWAPKKTSTKDYARATHDFILLTLVPTMLLIGLRAALQGSGDDDKSFAERLAREGIANLLGLVVGGRELAAMALGYDYQGPAGARLIPTIYKVAKQVGQGEVDKELLEALNMAAGLMFGYYATQVQRTVEGAEALVSGDSINPLVLLFGPRRGD